MLTDNPIASDRQEALADDPFADIDEWLEQISRDTDQEAEALERLRVAIETIQDDLSWYWHWGDGRGGAVLEMLATAVRSEGYSWPFDDVDGKNSKQKKATISRRLSKAVMERDAYRCVTCGTHMDLSCDHVIPESKGGPTILENLQTMCTPCNSRKGNRV